MSTTALALTGLLLLFPIIVSYKEKLHIIKDLLVSTIRAVIQLVILGYLLHFIFNINQKWVLIIFVLIIIVNAAWNTIGRASVVMHHVFLISLISIFIGVALPLVGVVLTGQLNLNPMKLFQYQVC